MILQGTSATIKAPAVLAGDASGSNNIVTISNSTVDLSGFTISGPGDVSCVGLNVGIFVRDGAIVNIHDNTITDIRNEPLSGCQTGNGILVGRNLFSTTGTATITNNQILNYQKTGIVVDNVGSSAIISGNTVTGVSATPLIAQNGIQISRGAVATVTDNIVSGNQCDHAVCGSNMMTQTQSAGILLFRPGDGVLVISNTISGNDMGIYNVMTTAGTTSIIGNTFLSNRYIVVVLNQGNIIVNNNEISGGNTGIVAVSFNGNTANSVGTISNNTISSAQAAGIQLLDGSVSDSFIPTITAHRNRISANGIGLNNTLTDVINASTNWWGDATGPLHAINNPSGLGDEISDNVNFVDFCINPTCD